MRRKPEPPAPDQTGVLAQVGDLLEEALEDVDPESPPNTGQARVIGQRLV
jgi:hypothetical protein